MPRANRSGRDRPELLQNAPMRFAPENELGVVFLFAQVAGQLGLRVEEIRQGFPDCIAYRRSKRGEKKVRIEFEFRSSAFKRHGHSARGCDMIVCWLHDWQNCPSHLEVIELRREFRRGFDVWLTCVADDYKEVMKGSQRAMWSVPGSSRAGDLVLYYFTRPESAITHIYKLEQDPEHRLAGWKPGKDWMAPIVRVCRLPEPITLKEMQSDRTLRKSSFARSPQGRRNMTEFWPYLYRLILRRSPSLRRKLRAFDPQAWG